MIVVYDLEQFSNFHSCFAVDIDSKQEFYFETSDYCDDSVAYYEFLQQCKGMIGYNSLHYDYPLLHWFITKGFKQFNDPMLLVRQMYKESQRIIDSKWGIPEWKHLIPQLDLFKVWHFDNKAKMTSLKDLQVAMNWHNVQDLPFKHTHHVENDERDEIKYYNRNDTMSTLKFYELSRAAIDLRKNLRKKYGIKCRNWSNSKIGEQIFLEMLSKRKGIPKKILKNQRTHRSSIKLSQCILDYNIDNDEVHSFIEYISSKEIKETKGSIKYRILYNGMPYDFGTGGIHGSKHPNVYEATDEYLIMTSDVSSYYPNLSIQNRFYPQHLGIEFVETYSEMYIERTKAKFAKVQTGDTIATNKGLKESLNSAYGKSNDKYSFLYDPKYTMTTTINGQLQLTDLSITLQKEGFECIMINTDGFEFIVHKNDVDKYKAICQAWMDETKLVLEHGQYKKIAIRDVNNYIAQDINGDIKHKGAFEIDKDWHKDPSFKIIRIALQEYFINGVAIEDTIKNHDNIFDFCGRVKSNSGYQIEWHSLEDDKLNIKKLQKTNRVYIAKVGGYLYKTKGDRMSGVYKGLKTQVMNKYAEREDYMINYNWYLRETQKIIDIIEPKQLKLF